jgi:hypothetical protein
VIYVNPLVDDNISEEDLKKYVNSKHAELESDYSLRTNGIKNKTNSGLAYAGYSNLRDFYNGDHWSYVKEDGSTLRVYNYCRTVVLNYQAFLANEPPEFDMPPRDESDDIEIARVDQVEKIISDVLGDNNFPVVFSEAVHNQSLLGDAFIFGPYIEWQNIGGEKKPRIKFVNVKSVENVRVIWSNDNYEEMDGFVIDFRISKERAEDIFSEEMKKRGLSTLPTGFNARNTNTTAINTQEFSMVNVRYFWNKKYMLALVGDSVVDFVKHDWGFIPGQIIKNISHPTLPWGISDIEDVLDAQVEYNESVSATRSKINQVAIPHIFYAGEGEPMQYSAGQAEMVKLGPDDRLFPDPTSQSTAPFVEYMQARRNDINSLSQISDIFFGGTNVTRATGRALSVLLQGVNNRVKQKQVRWKRALRSLIADTLRLIEIHIPESRELIQGYYKIDIFFPSVLIRNVVDEMNKFDRKLQSLETTQKNIGIPSPKDEQKKMKKEWEDLPLMAEISRNPQLHLQLQQMMAQGASGNAQQVPGGGPMMQESQNMDEQPAATRGVPIQSPESPEGAARQNQFRENQQ